MRLKLISHRLFSGICWHVPPQSPRAMSIGRAWAMTPAACGIPPLDADQPAKRDAAQAVLDLPHARARGPPGKTIECTPIVIDGVMYITTALSSRRGPGRRHRQRALAV